MAPARDLYVDVNGLPFHYRDWGGTGRPMVLLHGLASNAHIWDFVAPDLARHFRVGALDQRGHGLSARPDGDYGFQTVTGDLRAFVHSQGLEQPVLVGHSWGASVVLNYAAQYPNEVAALVLVDGGLVEMAHLPGITWEKLWTLAAPPKLDGVSKEELLATARSWDLGRQWSPQLEGVVLGSFDVHQDGTVAPRLSRENHRKILRALFEYRVHAVYPHVRCPVLALPTRLSRQTHPFRLSMQESKPTALALLQQRIADAEVVWMEETIHDVPLQRPQEMVDAMLRFLRRRVA